MLGCTIVDYYINDDETRLGDNTHLVLSSNASASASAWSPTLPHLVPQTIYGEKERIASSTTASETSLFSGSRQGENDMLLLLLSHLHSIFIL